MLLASVFTVAQKKSATVSGKILDDNENPLAKVSVVILGRTTGVITNDSGLFTLKVPADKAFALVFTYTSYRTEQRNFYLNENEKETVVIRLERSGVELQEVTEKPLLRSG